MELLGLEEHQNKIMLLAQSLDLNKIRDRAFPDFNFGYGAGPGDIINKVIPYVFAAAGIAMLIYLVLGGLQMMTSQGDPKAMEGAKGKITNAILGFVIIVVAYSLVVVLGKIFNLSSFSDIFGGGK